MKKQKNVAFGKNVKISKEVEIVGQCSIGDGCKVLGCSRLEDVVLENGCTVENSQIAKSHICQNTHIGPFANIRSGCIVGKNCKIGAFVEIKNSLIASGCKISHLAYVGDAELGENVNVGCGVVFANYDGKKKSHTKVGNNVFIGCNVNVVAPVSIADECYICAGTTVTKNTNKGDFVIGRVQQENKSQTPQSED